LNEPCCIISNALLLETDRIEVASIAITTYVIFFASSEGHGPVDQVEVEVFKSEVCKSLLESWTNGIASMSGVPQLAGDEDLFALLWIEMDQHVWEMDPPCTRLPWVLLRWRTLP